MMTESNPKTLESWLREAWSDAKECPPPEVFLPSEWDELGTEARRRAERHLERCPACAAERDLAVAFEAEPIADPREKERLEAVLRRVDTPVPEPVPGTRVLAFPPVAGWVPRRLLPIVAAAMVAVVAGLVVRGRTEAPALPEPPVDDVMRSARIDGVSPVGDLEEPPRAFAWRETEGAASYLVTLSGVDGTVLWSGTTEAPPLPLPGDIRSRLQARVVYSLRVEAFDSKGARTATSEPIQFRSLSGPDRTGETPR